MASRVLVVDHEDLGRMIAELLDIYGYTTHYVNNIGEALREITGWVFDAALIHKNVGGHRGVYGVLEKLRDEKPNVEVVLYTGEPYTEQLHEELYFHRFLKEGVDMPENLKAIFPRLPAAD